MVSQQLKHDQIVCGDHYVCEKKIESTEFFLCDGIGSGIYANIAAITCASRLAEFFRKGVSLRSASEMIANSMHRARKEDIPFSAFSAAKVLNNGQFTVYTYEAVNPILIKDGTAIALKEHFYSAGYEAVGESFGTLEVGDSLILCSDGVSQAGMGHGYTFGIEVKGIVDFINRKLAQGVEVKDLPQKITQMAAEVSQGRYEDDTTIAVLHCREAEQLTVISGPPSIKAKDHLYVERFLSTPGKHVICGSTTADIISRIANKKVYLVSGGTSFGSPPEYAMEGVDMVTEGAVLLNQAYNILDENPDTFSGESAVERFSALLQKADIITFMIGRAVNDAHSALVFKQMGIHPRSATIKLIAEQLREMGKLVIEEYY